MEDLDESGFLNDPITDPDAIFINVFGEEQQVQFIIDEDGPLLSQNVQTKGRPKWHANFRVGDSSNVYKLCYVCDQTVLGLRQFMNHLRLHTEEMGPYECRVCHKLSCANGLALHEHMRDHYKGVVSSDGNESNHCDEASCTGLKFESKAALTKHVSSEHSKSNAYRCRECHDSFTCFNAKEFTEHMVGKHGKKPFQCEHCGMRYMYKQSLEDHLISKHTDGDPKLPCDVCGKKFMTRTNLINHRREQHELGEKRKAKCDICGFISKGLRNLKKHREVHDLASYKRFQCGRCPRMFRSRHSLSVHDRVHTGEAPYRCEVCSVNFKRIHHLKSHLKSATHSSKEKQLTSDNVTKKEEERESDIYMRVVSTPESMESVRVLSEKEDPTINDIQTAVLFKIRDDEFIIE